MGLLELRAFRCLRKVFGIVLYLNDIQNTLFSGSNIESCDRGFVANYIGVYAISFIRVL